MAKKNAIENGTGEDLPGAISVDVTIENDGDFNAELDSDKLDVKVKKTDKKVKISVEFDKGKIYEIVSNGKSKHMEKGKVFKVIGNMAKILIEKGVATLKED